jgi:hypothetical protein
MGYCCWWEDVPFGQLVLYEKNFGWMDVWELNPEWLGSLWLRGFWGSSSLIFDESDAPFPQG